MRIEWLLIFLILVIFISGCPSNGGEIKPVYSDNAVKMDIKIKEKEEMRRILPGQTIRMVVTLTNQVENETENVFLKITNPYGIFISKMDCGSNCVCQWNPNTNDYDESGCPSDIDCNFNGCYYNSIQSLDKQEITFALKVPSEEEMSAMGRDLKPKITLEYDYRGTSVLYIPIYKRNEEPLEPKTEFTQTTGPIHVGIDSDNWVREGDEFPVYINVEDVAHSTEKLTVNQNNFSMQVGHVDIDDPNIGRCDFLPTSYTHPRENITLPLDNPLVCTLKASKDPTAPPMVKAPIIIDYLYTYKVENIQTIRVEKAFLGIF